MMAKCLAAIAALVSLVTGPVHAAYVVAGNGQVVSSTNGSYAWDLALHTVDRAVLEDPTVFGGAGVVVGPSINTIDLPVLDAASLAGVDAFVSSFWSDAESAPYEALLRDFFLAGGDLYLFNDGPDRDGIADLLGLPTLNASGGNPNSIVAGGALDGPFGSADVEQGGQVGVLDEATVLSAGGSVCARAADGAPTAACWSAGAYQAGAGSLVILADTDMIAQATYTGSVPDNGEAQLWLNMFAFGTRDQPVVVGAPSPAWLLLIGLLRACWRPRGLNPNPAPTVPGR